ncbi:MAG: hypothetical protein J6K43_16480 [Lachnospiraceae bacterium]|nr:hypothetical protein [Lachnospiraceae bacterium]
MERENSDEKKENFSNNFIFILIVIIATVSVREYRAYQEKKRLEQPPYFTMYELNMVEILGLVRLFRFEGYYEMTMMCFIQDICDNNDSIEEWPDFSNYFNKLEPSEDTEVVVAIMNYRLFGEQNSTEQEALEKAKAYGINAENPLTVE